LQIKNADVSEGNDEMKDFKKYEPIGYTRTLTRNIVSSKMVTFKKLSITLCHMK